jgi:LPXTG-motif cell wall-anchored protein
MKRFLIFILVLSTAFVLPVHAANGSVTYSGNAGDFLFAPGSNHSLTDLFPDFKDVMPGDVLTQQITVKNTASNQVKVKIYIRSKGAQAGSEDFLSQLRLKVATSQQNTMAYMFDAAAHETAQLSEWVCLGTLYSGGVVNLDVTLTVPTSMGNEFQNQVGYLDWEFMIEEFPIEDTDPEPPKTGDRTPVVMMVVLMGVSVVSLLILILMKRKKREEEEQNVQEL